MKKLLFILMLGIYSLPTFTQEPIVKPLIIGNDVTIHSTVLNEERILNIYLPNNYDSTKAYPIIYLLDGSKHEDFMHISGLVQFFNLMYAMPEHIVVGIENVDRKRDFTFTTNLKKLKKKYPTTGHSDKFIQFISEELQPYIQQHYKTNNEKILIGQSLGGLLATEILLNQPQLFTHYCIISPSLWWDNESIFETSKEKIEQQNGTQKWVYIAVGKGEDPLMQKEAESLQKLLTAYPNKYKVNYKLMIDENHATILHNSIYEALKILYPYQDAK